jgi:hypothetical protein
LAYSIRRFFFLGILAIRTIIARICDLGYACIYKSDSYYISMARRTSNGRERLKKALQLRSKLVAEGAYGPSLDRERYFGIVVGHDSSTGDTLSYIEENERYEFMSEAEEIRENALASGYRAEILATTERDRALSFLSRVSMTDVVLIGHGQLGRLNLGESGLGWWHVARSMDHLKQGYFIQRHCGVLWQAVNVAVGTFAMADMRNVIAPAGEPFTPQDLYDEEANQLLQPVYTRKEHTYEELVTMYPQFSKR